MGVMAIVISGGVVKAGDGLNVIKRPDFHQALRPV